VPVGGYDTGGSASSVDVVGNIAFVADSLSLEILDVSNPYTPRRRGGFKTLGNASSVDLVGDVAFLATGDRELEVVRLREGVVQDLKFEPPPSVTWPQTSFPLEPPLGSIG
jgi:hypothetical protein